jgi:glyoxalase family protein
VREDGRVRFDDPEGLTHELLAVDVPDAPLVASHPDIPDEHALRGFHGVRAYASDPARSAGLLEMLGFEGRGPDWRAAGEQRRGQLTYDAPPAATGIPGAGTVHHVAWSAADDNELETFRGLAAQGGARPTPIIDRQYFHSVYFREPSGVLFELASRDIGFDVDEPRETLGEALKLPPQHEHLRAQLEHTLTPLGV